MYYSHKFNGFDYEVVNGSVRDRLFRKARVALTMGLMDQAYHWHIEGIRSPGCARAHRLGVRHG